MAIMFGTAGIPETAWIQSTETGVRRIRDLGLDCMEIQFVRGVKMQAETAGRVKAAALESGVALSCHAPYYVNLATTDVKKAADSIRRIVDAAKAGATCGADTVVFHAGSAQEDSPDQAFSRIRKNFEKAAGLLKKEISAGVTLRPEVMGKHGQFGGLEEVCRLCLDLDYALPCVDVSHLFARSGGSVNSFSGFMKIFETIHSFFGRRGIENMHIHLSGIEYTQGGEKRHVPMKESEINHREFLDALFKARARGRIICESPGESREKDSISFKKYYHHLEKSTGQEK